MHLSRKVAVLLLAALTTYQGFGAAATVSTFTGGDAGEGLDLQGNFTYAINVGPSGAAGLVGDANFTADNVSGVLIDASQSIGTGGWGAVDYGPTDNDKNLSTVMKSIRWAPAPAVVTVTLDVEKGSEYKLQLLFHEDCCAGRGFNIVMDGTTEVTNLRPGRLQQGDTHPSDPNFSGDFNATKNSVGVVVTKQFVATSDKVVIVCDGPAAEDPDVPVTDHNAILNGFTLERLSATSDTDGDGLADDWEKKYFGNLSQTGTADPDGDGLTNLQEQALKTNPTLADTDGDGLNDGYEASTSKSDPLKVDTDGDTLTDGNEVNVWHTDPTKRDSDGDGTSDLDETLVGTDPSSASSKPLRTTVGVVTGGDPGEGLDLQGKFIYALAIGAGDDANVQVGDAAFAPLNFDEVPGASLTAANGVARWYNVSYGDSVNDQNLALATSSIRYQGPTVELVLNNLKVGAEYKVQLLFGELCCNRGFGISFDDRQVAREINPGQIHGGIGNLKQEAVVTHLYFAKSTSMKITLDVRGASFPDPNAILNAVTVEEVAAPADADGDGLPDAWENLYFGNTAQAANADPDGDGLDNAGEYAFGSDPTKADADADGLNDSQEKTAGTNPNFSDTDGDGLKDGAEVNTHRTDPLKKDTDGDNLGDGVEVNTIHTDPTKADTDGDGVKDGFELTLGTNPLVADRPSLTSIGAFTGGDKGEGLDLDGNFIYALAIGAPDGTDVKVRDAQFLALSEAEVPGATLVAGNRIQNWYPADYGDSADDDNLEVATSSIRWSDFNNPNVPAVVLTLENLEVGAQYKVQIMAGEQCCNRGYHVYFDDKIVVRDFNPGKLHGGIANHRQEAVLTQLYFARGSTMVIRLDGRGADNSKSSDHNAILNAVTVEKVSAPADTDNDGMPDEWEKFYFGNLAQGANADPDGDGLTNLKEFQLGSDPLAVEPNRDTDGDGLPDGDEGKIYNTDPAKADTDGDGLSDGAEIKTSKTDPTKGDTDGDGLPDGTELLVGTNPLVAEPKTVFSNLSSGAFTGGDPGEGLDLAGNFLYAFNVSSAGAAGKAGDANFTADNAPGVVVTAAANVAAWNTPEYGDSTADNVVEKVTSSIRYGPSVKVQLANLLPGGSYKLQLLFYEQCCGNRGFNVWADGVLIAENFNPSVAQGGVNNTAAGAVVSAEFTTQRDNLVIVLTSRGVTDPSLTDPNAILDGVTLEYLGGGSSAPKSPTVTATARTAAGFAATFQSEVGKSYTLEYRASLTSGAWVEASDTVSATGAITTLTDSNAGRLAGQTGFYRVRAQ